MMRFRWMALVWLLLVGSVLVVGALSAWATPVAAQGPTPTPVITDDQVNAIAKQLYCPVCENIPLDVCGTQACAQWRELIREKLQQGWTEEQIKQYFVEQYGDRVLATPPPKGFNLLVYVLPPVAILAGVFFLYRVLQSWRKPAPAEEVAAADEDELSAIEAALRRLDEEDEA